MANNNDVYEHPAVSEAFRMSLIHDASLYGLRHVRSTKIPRANDRVPYIISIRFETETATKLELVFSLPNHATFAMGRSCSCPDMGDGLAHITAYMSRVDSSDGARLTASVSDTACTFHCAFGELAQFLRDSHDSWNPAFFDAYCALYNVARQQHLGCFNTTK